MLVEAKNLTYLGAVNIAAAAFPLLSHAEELPCLQAALQVRAAVLPVNFSDAFDKECGKSYENFLLEGDSRSIPPSISFDRMRRFEESFFPSKGQALLMI